MLCAHLGDMACEEDESKAAPQRRAAPIGRLLTAADDLGSQAVATPANEVQIPYAGANRLLDLANGMVPTCAPLNSPCLSMGSCAVPLYVVGVDAMVATLRKAFFNEPTASGVLLRGSAGLGKSTIARAYVAAHIGPGSPYPGGVIWLTGNTVAAITKRIGLDMHHFSPPTSAVEMGPWLQHWLATRLERWLVVVDDVGNGGGVGGGGDTATDTVLEWVGRLFRGQGGHVLVTTRASTPPRVAWLAELKVVVVPPLTLDQAVLVMWRRVRWWTPLEDHRMRRLHAATSAQGNAGKSQRRDVIPAGVLDTAQLVLFHEWGHMLVFLADLWQHDHDGSRQQKCIRDLVPGSSSDPVAMAESQGITLLQWLTRLLLVRPEVSVDQLQQRVMNADPLCSKPTVRVGVPTRATGGRQPVCTVACSVHRTALRYP